MDSYCTKCSLQFGNVAVYNMHLSIVHKENVEIKDEPKCDILEKDIEEPEKVTFQCENCGKPFSDKKKLKNHVSTVHNRKKAFKCEICDYTFPLKGSLKLHIASFYENKKPFKCDICDYSCSQKGACFISS